MILSSLSLVASSIFFLPLRAVGYCVILLLLPLLLLYWVAIHGEVVRIHSWTAMRAHVVVAGLVLTLILLSILHDTIDEECAVNMGGHVHAL